MIWYALGLIAFVAVIAACVQIQVGGGDVNKTIDVQSGAINQKEGRSPPEKKER
jgi:hypothetical protein